MRRPAQELTLIRPSGAAVTAYVASAMKWPAAPPALRSVLGAALRKKYELMDPYFIRGGPAPALRGAPRWRRGGRPQGRRQTVAQGAH